MKFPILALALVAASLLFASSSSAQPAPVGSTAVCGDGSYSHAATEKGACSHHGGVKTWTGNTATAAAPNKPTPPMPPIPSPTPAPAATTPHPVDMVSCRDGTMAQLPVKQGTCSHHGGVGTPAALTTAPLPTRAPVGTASQPPTDGHPNKVWVNSASHVYHCNGDRWYGKTKAGDYMSESDAIAKGNRAVQGKACH